MNASNPAKTPAPATPLRTLAPAPFIIDMKPSDFKIWRPQSMDPYKKMKNSLLKLNLSKFLKLSFFLNRGLLKRSRLFDSGLAVLVFLTFYGAKNKRQNLNDNKFVKSVDE